MKLNKDFFITLLVIVLLAVACFSLFGSPKLGAESGPNHYNQENFIGGLSVGGQTYAADTPLNAYNCVTASWTPGALSADGTSTAATSTDISASTTVSRAVVGNTCSASFSAATSSNLRVGCLIYENGTTTLTLSNVGGASLTPASGTAKVCYWQ